MANSGVFQLHGIHQVMQRDVRITAAEPREKWRHQSTESNQRITAKRTKEKIEPNYIWFQPAQRFEDAVNAARVVKRPATQN
jgi:hypothetical protein